MLASGKSVATTQKLGTHHTSNLKENKSKNFSNVAGNNLSKNFSASGKQEDKSVGIMWDGRNVTPHGLVPKVREERRKEVDPAYLEIMPERDASSPIMFDSDKTEVLTKADLEVVVTIELKETPTETLFHLPSLCVALDNTALHSAVALRNKAYEELCNSKLDSDQYVDTKVQTLNLPQKVKEVLAAPPDTGDMGVNASQWDIYDTFSEERVAAHKLIEQEIDKDAEEQVSYYSKRSGCFFRFKNEEKESKAEWAYTKADWKAPESLAPAVRVLERSVAQTHYHRQHLIYRNYTSPEDQEKETRAPIKAQREEDENDEPDVPEPDPPYLEDLFCFRAKEVTKGMTTTSAQWNRSNQDLLAVSYANSTKSGGSDGAMLFWSLKNPTYPERVIMTSSGVSSIAFSQLHPNMIAAGMNDGQVCIYDLRRATDQPILESGNVIAAHTDKKHSDTVWEATWIAHEGREVLVTAGGDGRVLQWSLSKGLEQKLLMHLKRIPNPDLGSNCWFGHKDGIVFRHTAGLGLDFPADDPSVYLAATEDGLLHRCSTSYYEQYLDTYFGHTGPVYKVRCSPFWHDAFLTCSADWTIRLWTVKGGDACHTCQAQDLFDGVNDIYWSPTNSTVFSAAMDDGRVELWDLSIKPHDPLVIHYPRGSTTPRTCVRFADSPVLVSGDVEGNVDIMRIYNSFPGPPTVEEQIAKLEAVIGKTR